MQKAHFTHVQKKIEDGEGKINKIGGQESKKVEKYARER